MIDSPGIALIKANEGCRLLAYDDAQPNVLITSRNQVKGTLTIGYGFTGQSVYPGQTWTQAQADTALLQATAPIEAELDDRSVVTVPLNDNQHGALLSFVYNVGLTAFMRSSMLKHINMGLFEEVTADFYCWIYVKGVRTPGLLRRRIREATLWNTPVQEPEDDEVLST